MNTFNRVVLSIIFLIVFLASTIGVLVALDVLSTDRIQQFIPYRQVVSLLTANAVVSVIAGTAFLLVFVALGVLWLRAELAVPAKAAIGGTYETAAAGPGVTTVDYSVVAKALDGAIRSTPGVLDSQTRIFKQSDGRFIANSNLLVRRTVDIHAVDKAIRDRINDEWLHRLGSDLTRHELFIHLEAFESKVA